MHIHHVFTAQTYVFSIGDRRPDGEKSRHLLWNPALDRSQPHFQSL
jgi:hypothetical protein